MPLDPRRVNEDKRRTLAQANGENNSADADQGFASETTVDTAGRTTGPDVLGSDSIRVLSAQESTRGRDVTASAGLLNSVNEAFPGIGSSLQDSGGLVASATSQRNEKFRRQQEERNSNQATTSVGNANSATIAPDEVGYSQSGSTLPKESVKQALGSQPATPTTSDKRAKGTNTVFTNPLEVFASHNVVMTLGALTVNSVNDPVNTYRKRGADFTILRSGGGGINDKRVTTAFDKGGNLEYFIDDVNIESIVNPNGKTGMSTGTRLEFKVFEPYSLGVFLQSLEIAATDAGHKNYVDAPFLLEIDFIGYDNQGKSTKVEYSSRKIPFKLLNVQFDVDNGGSVYEVTGIPWNEQALSDVTQRIKDPVSITGATLAEAMSFGETSLSAVINQRYREIAERNDLPNSDLYVIRFPRILSSLGGSKRNSEEEPSATINREQTGRPPVIKTEHYLNRVNSFFGQNGPIANNNIYQSLTGSSITDINSIGRSRMVNDFREGTEHPFPRGLATYDREGNVFTRGGIELTLSDEERIYKFPQNMSIQKIIEEMVLLSKWASETVDQVDKDGMINWFKVEVACYLVDDPVVEDVTGSKPKIYVYSVVPYRVHASAFTPPNKGVVGAKELAKQVAKQYDYVYSGTNKDVLKFDIRFNMAYYEAVRADIGNESGSTRKGATDKVTTGDPEPTLGVDSSSGDQDNSHAMVKYENEVHNSHSGAPESDPKQNLAKQFHNTILNSDADLITAELEIWGDPYYLPDSGMGNYTSQNSGIKTTINADGSIDYQRNQVDILINFRTPVDYRRNGTMEFQSETTLVEGFSGFYMVTTVVSTISGNQFTQTLDLIRRKNQTTEGISTARTAVEKTNTGPGETNGGRAGQTGTSNGNGTPPPAQSPNGEAVSGTQPQSSPPNGPGG